MDISVIGAGGAIGWEIVAQLVAGRVLKPTERLQLVGKHGGASERVLFGLRSDLTDAYTEVGSKPRKNTYEIFAETLDNPRKDRYTVFSRGVL